MKNGAHGMKNGAHGMKNGAHEKTKTGFPL